MTNHLSFSGHETFACKTLWLKKGYDFVVNGGDFNAASAVSDLGVGKNMVSSIRFWLKAFDITENDRPTLLGDKIFDDNGWDPYCEDMSTMWLLHYSIVSLGIASIYNIAFTGLKRNKIEFTRTDLSNYIEMVCRQESQLNAYNERTVNKDIGVFLQNYAYPVKAKSVEDYSNLLLNLELIHNTETKITANGTAEYLYQFDFKSLENINPSVVLYALLDYSDKDIVLSNDKISDLALIFCLSEDDFKTMLRNISKQYPDIVTYSDNSGIINVGVNKDVDKFEVLDNYYRSL